MPLVLRDDSKSCLKRGETLLLREKIATKMIPGKRLETKWQVLFQGGSPNYAFSGSFIYYTGFQTLLKTCLPFRIHDIWL